MGKKILHTRPMIKTAPRLAPSVHTSIEQNLSARALMARAYRMASLLTDRAQLVRNLASTTYDGLRKMYDILGYPRPDTIKTEDYYQCYKRGDIGSSILSFYPRATWKDNIRIAQDKESPNPSKFDIAVESLWDKFHIWSLLMRADIMSGIGEDGWSIIFLGADDSLDLAQELTRGQLMYLTPYSQIKAKVVDEVRDTNNERFGLPQSYSIQGLQGANRVHWSRVIHITNNVFDSRWKGMPELENVWNRLVDLDKLVGGGAESAWRNMNSLKMFDIEPESKLGEISDEQWEDFRDQIDEVIHGFKDYALTQGMRASQLSTTVAQFGSNVDTVISLIAGTKSIPKRELLGSESGELASTQDATSVDETVRERQIEKAVPIIRSLVDKFMTMGVLPTVDNYEVILPSIEALNDIGKAELTSKLAAANKSQFEAEGVIVITSEEIRRDVWDKDPLEITNDPNRTARHAADLADTEPNEPDWKAIHRVADSHIDPLSTLIDEIFANASSDVGSIDTAAGDAIKSIEQSFNDLMPDQLMGVINDAGIEVLDVSRKRGSFYRTARVRKAQFELEFDYENPSAVDWALTRSSELITEIGPDTKDAIQLMIAEGQARNISAAQLVRDIRQMVGLRTDQVQSLLGFMDRLDSAEPGNKVFMGVKNGEEIYVTIPKGGLTNSFRIQQYNRYAAQLRLQRARLIARTETLRSANQGQRELWFQAQRAGELPQQLNRVWIATLDNRTRDEHAEWDGAITGVNEPFEFGVEPGEEPNCRCGQGLVS